MLYRLLKKKYSIFLKTNKFPSVRLKLFLNNQLAININVGVPTKKSRRGEVGINLNLWAIVEENTDIDRIASTAVFNVHYQGRNKIFFNVTSFPSSDNSN